MFSRLGVDVTICCRSRLLPEMDLDKLFDAISGGAAQSWQMDKHWKTMAADSFDFGFAVDWMRKDLGLALEEARANGATLPVTALIDQFYADEIGRAECRERVCQYGLISGAADSLTKTKNRKHRTDK